VCKGAPITRLLMYTMPFSKSIMCPLVLVAHNDGFIRAYDFQYGEMVAEIDLSLVIPSSHQSLSVIDMQISQTPNTHPTQSKREDKLVSDQVICTLSVITSDQVLSVWTMNVKEQETPESFILVPCLKYVRPCFMPVLSSSESQRLDNRMSPHQIEANNYLLSCVEFDIGSDKPKPRTVSPHALTVLCQRGAFFSHDLVEKQGDPKRLQFSYQSRLFQLGLNSPRHLTYSKKIGKKKRRKEMGQERLDLTEMFGKN